MKYVVALGFVAVIVGVFAYTAIFESPNTNNGRDNATAEVASNEVENESVDAKEVEKTTGKSSLEALRLLGKSLECTVSYESATGGETVEGTFFVSNDKVRGDFLTESPDLNGQILSSIILDGTMFYTWSEIDGEQYGMKMDTAMFDSADAAPQQGVSMDTEVDYECVPWVNVDNTVFVPPSTVLFQDFGDVIRAGMEYGTLYEEGAELPY